MKAKTVQPDPARANLRIERRASGKYIPAVESSGTALWAVRRSS
jgi:hypothetical protein